jgi:hypothetical protein
MAMARSITFTQYKNERCLSEAHTSLWKLLIEFRLHSASALPLTKRLLQENAAEWEDFVEGNAFIQGVKKG